MANPFDPNNLAELVENPPTGPEWQAWLQTQPALKEEFEIAQRVRQFMLHLQQADIRVPADFETRLLARIRADKTLLDLLELGLVGFGQIVIELLNLLFALLPTVQPDPTVEAL